MNISSGLGYKDKQLLWLTLGAVVSSFCRHYIHTMQAYCVKYYKKQKEYLPVYHAAACVSESALLSK